MPNATVPKPAAPDDNREAQPNKKTKVEPRKALKEQQTRELPTNGWPGKGAA